MRTLILSCDTGEGHNSCAKAIEEYYLNQGEYCRIKEGLQFISPKLSRFISWGHSFVYKYIPWLFNWGYGLVEKYPAAFSEKAVMYKMLAQGTKRLHQYIKENEFDRVICVHVFTALMVSDVIRKYQPALVSSFVSTDYTCYPGVKDCCLDYYFIPSENMIQEFVCDNIPKEKIIASGIPVRQMFYTQYNKTEAKIRNGIKPSHKHLLLMCGSMGCGPMNQLLKKLTSFQKDELEITVVCGRNKKLKKRLEKYFGQSENIHIRGYVRDMSLLMDSGDLYITKSGGISISEAAVKKLPMLLLHAVAGCEAYNRAYFVENGGVRAGENLEKLTELVVSIVEDTGCLCDMRARLMDLHKTRSAQVIFERMQEGHIAHGK